MSGVNSLRDAPKPQMSPFDPGFDCEMSWAEAEQVVPDRSVLDYAKETTAVDGLNEIGRQIDAVTASLDALIEGKLEVRSGEADTIYLDTEYPVDLLEWERTLDILRAHHHPVTREKLSVTCHAEADTINITSERVYLAKGDDSSQSKAPKQLPPENRLMGWDRYADTYNDLVERHGIMMGKYKEVCGEE